MVATRRPLPCGYAAPDSGGERIRGRLLVVMLNTDDYEELAPRLEVRSLPLLKIFRNGAVIDTLQGVESEPGLRVFLN